MAFFRYRPTQVEHNKDIYDGLLFGGSASIVHAVKEIEKSISSFFRLICMRRLTIIALQK